MPATIINTNDDPTELLELMTRAKAQLPHDPCFYPIFEKWLLKNNTVLHTAAGVPKVSAQGLNRSVTNAITTFANHYALTGTPGDQLEKMTKKMSDDTLKVKDLPDFLDTAHTKENLDDFYTRVFGSLPE